MNKVPKKTRQKWFDKAIKRLKRANSKEREEDDTRDPHKVPSPFMLEAPHTHQDSEEAIRSPAIFLACATQPKEGGEEEIMGINSGKEGKKGDPRMVITCKCSNPKETDSQRKAWAQEIEPGESPLIPSGSHLVSSRVVFLLPGNQQCPGKNVFLLQVTHPAINQTSPEDLIKSAGQALVDIKERLRQDEASHTAEMDDRYFQLCMSDPPEPSAPTLMEFLKQEQEQGAVGGDLPYDEGDKIPGAHNDQNDWIHPEAAKQEPDRKEQMIIIHKKESSQNKKSLEFLTNEQFAKVGWNNLKFPDQSLKNAKDALPGDIWGYVLRAVPQEKKTYASFIKIDYQDIWEDKAVKTYNFGKDLEITLLMNNANEEKDLIHLQTHFAKWDVEVMSTIYANIEREEKKGTEDRKQEHKYDDIADGLRAEKERQAQEQTRRLDREHKDQLARQQAEFDQKTAEWEQKKKDLYKELSIISETVHHTRQHSRNQSRMSRVASSRTSRAPSPTNAVRETLDQAVLRLNQKRTEKNLNKRKQGVIEEILDMEVPKTERKSAYLTAEWTGQDDEIPLNWEENSSDEEDKKEEKKKLHAVRMRLKVYQAPKGNYICPDVDCIYTSSREDKIPAHVITKHGTNLPLVTEALLEIERLKTAQQEAKADEKAIKIKQEQEEKEVKIQTQLANLAKNMEALLEQKKGEEKPKTTPAKTKTSGQKDPQPKPNSKPANTGSTKNPYFKGGTTGNRDRDADGNGGGGGDDSSDDSDEDENNSDDEDAGFNRNDSEDEEDDDDYGGNTNEPDEEDVDTKENTTKRQIVQLNFNQAKYITPQCLKRPKIAKLLEYFAGKEALTRNDLRNVNGGHGTKNKKPQYSLKVAPWYEIKYKKIFKELGYPKAADDDFVEWYDAFIESRKGGDWLDDDARLQISNGYNQLMESDSRRLKTLIEQAPRLKNRASPDKITPQDVQKWMARGRVYCIKNQIYWKTFAKFMITDVTLNPKIKEQLDLRMNTRTFREESAWTISVYIERIIKEMLDPEESFGEREDRIVDKHVRALHKEESATMLRAELDSDAHQLTYLDPSYIKTKRQGNGYIHEGIAKIKMQGIKQRLLVTILKAADYYTDLSEMYNSRKTSSTVEEEEDRDVINDLTKILKNKKARKEKEAEAQVYSTRPQPQRATASERALHMRIAELEKDKLLSEKRSKGQLGANKDLSFLGAGKDPPKANRNSKNVGVGLKVPYSDYKNPCSKCDKIKDKTDKQKKAICAASHHCWNHDGEYMCTKAATCRIRTEKVKALMKYREGRMPPEASRATVNRLMEFTEEEIQEIPADRPCLIGEHCLQQTGGTHSKVCRTQMAEIEAENGEGPHPATPGKETVEEQQEFNLDLNNEFAPYVVRHCYEYEKDYGQEDQWWEGNNHN